MKRALIIPDCHFPYVDRKAYELMLTVALDVGDIDEVVILGDFADFYSVSSHKKHPGISTSLDDEVISVVEALEELDLVFPDAHKVFIEGNHEYRLERFLQNEAPALYGSLDCKTLFGLNNRDDWTWIPYGPNQKYQVLNSRLFARHEPFSMSSPAACAKKALCSLVYGHKHQRELCHFVGLEGIDHIVYSPGYLGGHLLYPEIYGYVKSHHQWQLGFDIVFADGKDFYPHIVQIKKDYTCVFGGKVYSP